jgi:hypothetical protein
MVYGVNNHLISPPLIGTTITNLDTLGHTIFVEPMLIFMLRIIVGHTNFETTLIF